MRRIRWTGRTMAHVCAWCGKPETPEDAEALRDDPRITRSHGICPDCRAVHFPELHALHAQTD